VDSSLDRSPGTFTGYRKRDQRNLEQSQAGQLEVIDFIVIIRT
jgi:hypothetical protein